MKFISTGCEDLNAVLTGHPTNGITFIYGKGGSGKTTLCLLASAAQLEANKKIVFLDTGNNFSLERLHQLYADAEKKSENILLLTVKNFNVQHQHIKDLMQIKNIGLIVVDAITTHYRRLYTREPQLAKAMLGKQLSILKEIAQSKEIPVIATSEVYSNLKGETLSLANDVVFSFCERALKLERDPRRMHIIKPDGPTFFFKIEQAGIRKV